MPARAHTLAPASDERRKLRLGLFGADAVLQTAQHGKKVTRAKLANGGSELVYTYDTQGPRTGITGLLTDLAAAGVSFKDLDTTHSSLEDIFVDLVRRER